MGEGGRVGGGDIICHTVKCTPTRIYQHIKNKKKERKSTTILPPPMHMHYANSIIGSTCLEVKQRREQTERLVGVKMCLYGRIFGGQSHGKFNLPSSERDVVPKIGKMKLQDARRNKLSSTGCLFQVQADCFWGCNEVINKGL